MLCRNYLDVRGRANGKREKEVGSQARWTDANPNVSVARPERLNRNRKVYCPAETAPKVDKPGDKASQANWQPGQGLSSGRS